MKSFEGLEALQLKIGGMHCDACIRRVTNALSQLPGVTVKQVEVGSASIAFDPSQAGLVAIADAVRETGFDVVS